MATVIHPLSQQQVSNQPLKYFGTSPIKSQSSQANRKSQVRRAYSGKQQKQGRNQKNHGPTFVFKNQYQLQQSVNNSHGTLQSAFYTSTTGTSGAEILVDLQTNKKVDNLALLQQQFYDQQRVQLKTAGNVRSKPMVASSNVASIPTTINPTSFSNFESLNQTGKFPEGGSQQPREMMSQQQEEDLVRFDIQERPRKKRGATANSNQRKKYTIYNKNLLLNQSTANNHQRNQNQMKNMNLTLEPYTSPGDYDIENLVGNKKISIACIKTPPQYSFSKSIRLEQELNRSLGSSQSHQIQTVNVNNKLNKSSLVINSPGVGDYDIENLKLQKKSPICTIGNGVRFLKIPSQQKYKQIMPASYISNLDDNQGPKKKLGVMGFEQRFKNRDVSNPGPGDYNTQIFKSLSKGEFSILNPQQVSSSSPRQTKTLSPFIASFNTFNKTSRQQQSKLYQHENEKDLLNKFGPGPGYYSYEKCSESIERHDKNRFSIPRSRRNIELKEWEKEKKVPLQYSDITKEIKLLLKSKGQGITIPSQKNKFDPRKMTSLHASMWRKGIII